MRVATIAAILSVASSASADEIARGSVVKIERDELFVNLGTARGVRDGARLRIKRTISFQHPISHQKVADWIPIGSARVTAAGAVMSRAIVGELTADVAVGDVAEILVEDQNLEPLAPNPKVPHDPETHEVLAIVSEQSGKSLAVRIAGWERYLSERPSSRFAAGVRRELDELRSLADQMRSTTKRSDSVAVKLDHAPPRTSPAGQPIDVVFAMAAPDQVASAFLHVRTRDALTYRKFLLAREHGIYLRGAIPAEFVKPPGVAYFVEASTPDGRAARALGSAARPQYVAVVEPTLPDRLSHSSGRSFLRLGFDALSYHNLDRRSGDRTDQLASTSLEVTYWVGGAIDSIGIGYGVMAGQGGARDAVWTSDTPAPRSGLNFGYADVELGGHVAGVRVSLGGQLIAGVGRTRFGLGGEGRIRIGNRNATNLMVGVRQLDQVGWLSQLRFATPLTQRVGLATFLGATNQPGRGDIAVQLGSEVEVLVHSRVALIGRASWQGRSIAHAGLGGGAGLSIRW